MFVWFVFQFYRECFEPNSCQYYSLRTGSNRCWTGASSAHLQKLQLLVREAPCQSEGRHFQTSATTNVWGMYAFIAFIAWWVNFNLQVQSLQLWNYDCFNHSWRLIATANFVEWLVLQMSWSDCHYDLWNIIVIVTFKIWLPLKVQGMAVYNL